LSRMLKNEFNGGAHTHGLGHIGLVLLCAALAVGGVVSLAGSFRLEDARLLWLLVPVMFAAIGSFYAYDCDNTRRTWGNVGWRDRFADAKPRVMAAAEKSHKKASTWQAMAFFFSLPGAAGTFEVLFL
jgi:hypothetical protein